MDNFWLKGKEERLKLFITNWLFEPVTEAVIAIKNYLEIHFPNNENYVNYENNVLSISTKNKNKAIEFQLGIT